MTQTPTCPSVAAGEAATKKRLRSTEQRNITTGQTDFAQIDARNRIMGH